MKLSWIVSILKSFCEPLEIKSSLINIQQVDAGQKANCNFVILVFFENHYCAPKKIKLKKKLFLDFWGISLYASFIVDDKLSNTGRCKG